MAKTLKNGFCQDVFLSSEELQRERQHPSVEGFVSRSQLGCDVGLSDQRLHCAPAWAQGQLWILWLSWKQQPVCRVPLMLWGVHIHLLLLGSLQVGVRSGTILSSGEGAVSSLQSSNLEHRHITPHFTGAGEQT